MKDVLYKYYLTECSQIGNWYYSHYTNKTVQGGSSQGSIFNAPPLSVRQFPWETVSTSQSKVAGSGAHYHSFLSSGVSKSQQGKCRSPPCSRKAVWVSNVLTREMLGLQGSWDQLKATRWYKMLFHLPLKDTKGAAELAFYSSAVKQCESAGWSPVEI